MSINGINSPYGLLTNISAIGNGGTQKLTAYQIYTDPTGTNTLSVPIFSGDPVVFSTVNAAPNPVPNGVGGTIIPLAAALNIAANVTPILGIFLSCSYQNPQGTLIQDVPYWPASTNVMPGSQITALVNDDPMVIFKVQMSSSGGTLAGATYLFNDIGQNGSLVVAAGGNFPGSTANNPGIGNTRNGISGYYLDGSTVAGGNATLNFNVKIVGISTGDYLFPNPLNTNPATVPGVNQPFIDLLCKFNNHIFGSSGVLGPVMV